MSRTEETVELVPAQKRRSRAGCLGWLLLLLVLGAAAALVKYVGLPLRAEKARLEQQLRDAAEREKRLKKDVADSQARAAELEAKQGELSGKLAETQAEREKLEGELKRVQDELSAILQPQISAGNVRIKRVGRELVVDVADQVLFESGQAGVSDAGQKILAQVAPSLFGLKGYTIEVAGHTDRTRVVNPETRERFPTNWELSTARATNVVRFLQERGKIPGSRLEAAGFAEFRPAAGNATADDRAKNRRIELILIPASAQN